MTKQKAITAARQQIREQLRTVTDYCAMPGCNQRWVHAAHINGSGMGGRLSTYRLENMWPLCEHHHDVFDGRTLQGRQRMLRRLAQAVWSNQLNGSGGYPHTDPPISQRPPAP